MMMDKDYFLNSEIPQWNGLNCNAEQSFLNLNSSIDHYSLCESAFSSMVSSPAASPAFGAAAAASVAASRYVGANNGHTNDSCCNSTLSSPSKLHLLHIDQIKMANRGNSVPLVTPLPPFDADPGFPVRDSKLSCFGRRFNGRATPLRLKNGEFSRRLSTPLMGNGKLPPVLNSPSINQHGSAVENKNLSQAQKEMSSVNGGFDKKASKLSGSGANSNGESSVFEQIPIGETCWKASNEMNFRKRKAISRGKMKADGSISYKGVAGDEDASAKRSKPTESCKNENGGSDNETEKQKHNQKPPKDYIHVRARRGQATDSHSLAERVRREKISERMKLLQDLVPGCNKVIGKAVMLDEIINYVESLQRQVEFLSMKLASVNPGLDFDMENLIFKNTFRQSANTPQEMYPLDSSAAAFYNHRSNNTNVSNEPLSQSSVDPIPLDAPLCHNSGVQLSSVHGFSESLPQFSAFCEDDLHTIVQMGFGQNLVNFPVENQTSNKGAEG